MTKKLFLASSAYVVLDRFVELFGISPATMTVGFIPTAADVYEDKSFVVRDREKLSALRFQIIDIHLTDITKEDLENQLASVAIIFVAGGNSFYLLEKMRESGFDTLILDLVAKGVYYV